LLVIGGRNFVRLDHAAEMLDLFPYCRARRPAATRHTEVMECTDERRVLASLPSDQSASVWPEHAPCLPIRASAFPSPMELDDAAGLLRRPPFDPAKKNVPRVPPPTSTDPRLFAS
jgi:hypothetical protein